MSTMTYGNEVCSCVLSGRTGQVSRCEGLGLGYGTQYFEHSVAPVYYACLFGPSAEFLPAYSVHVGDRSADPCQYCRPPIRQLQPAQCSTVSRKFRRAGSGITARITGRRGLMLISKSAGHRRSRACDGSSAHFPFASDAAKELLISSIIGSNRSKYCSSRSLVGSENAACVSGNDSSSAFRRASD